MTTLRNRLTATLGVAALGIGALAIASPALASTRATAHVTVAAAPAKLDANGIAKSRITVKVQLRGHADAHAHVALTLSDTPSGSGSCGSLGATSGTTNRDGILQTSYRTSLVSGFCQVTATVGSGKGSVTIDQKSLLAKSRYLVTLASSLTKVRANGTSTSELTVTVKNGSASVTSDPVLITSTSLAPGSCGVVALGSTSTSSSGTLTAVYTSSTVKGNCQLKATEAFSGSSSNAIVIQQS